MRAVSLACAVAAVAQSVLAAHSHSHVPVKIALKQQNLDILESSLYEVSDPSNPRYGDHYTLESLSSLVSPSPDAINSVTRWLKSYGARDIRIEHASDWMTAHLPHSLVQDFARIHRDSHLAHKYHAPVQHLDFILPRSTSQIRLSPRSSSYNKKWKVSDVDLPTWLTSEGTPANQRAAYGVPVSLVGTNTTNSQMVWGTGTYGFSSSDLSTYYSNMGIDSSEINELTTQGYPGVPGGDNFGEATLDVSLISAIAPGIRTIVSNTDNSSSAEESTGFGPALLNFVADLSQQSDVPYVLSMSLGSLSWDSCNLLCEGVVSLSNSSISMSDCTTYMTTQRQVCMYPDSAQIDRINIEFMKLGVRGVTLLAATGDGGSHFSFQRFDDSTTIGQLLNTVSCELNLPTFPAESPYVVGVGGTTWSSGSDQPVAWPASGSGFSWRFPRPSYQSKEVDAYLSAQASSLPPLNAYNSSNRAYPDVAALATNVPIVMSGFQMDTGGTSAAAPEFAALISLVNDHRLNNGLKPLGFVNPRLYEINRLYPGEAFYDMSTGSSSCDSSGFCCDTGFPAAVGWDPTTGLGRPIFPGLLKYLGQDD